jgi:thiol-disulfide isomerase/thioredoxin
LARAAKYGSNFDTDMDKSIWQRRQFLYLGLGAIGMGVATSWGIGSQQVDNSPNIASANALPVKSTAIAASNSLPEFQGIQAWLNSPPLSVKDLRGSIALIHIWTFACINCQRTLPYIVKWHQKYAAQGLKVVSVHTPEFPYERKIANIQAAIKKYGITYPVAVDNDFKTWQAYKNEYWPHLFLANRQGTIVYDRIGEGAYAETEQTIQKLLKT